MPIKEFNPTILNQTQDRLNQLTKPLGSLGRLEQLAIQLAGITGQAFPVVEKPAIIVAAADHGITVEGVSAFPQEVTALMVENFARGGAAINVFAKQIGAEVAVIDVGVNADISSQPIVHEKIRYGTRNFLVEDAMTEEEASAAIIVGKKTASDYIERGHGLLITGEMGIGNTSASSAVIAALTGEPVEKVVGIGTGLTEPERLKKVNVIKQAIANREIKKNTSPLSVLAKVGGLEIATLVGVILEGAEKQKPVLIDGFISTAAALVALKLEPAIQPYLMIAHQSAEAGHEWLVNYLQVNPILKLDLRLGEGTGAALAYPIVEAASRILREMATFKDLGL
ncbi:nicotinate-nucleotide--dimethylbenzimidazole phosphoribosyltransferase [Halalkalibacter akibai]|uniref:Nicotinate-nucleotide--dimethylbenzimidazole phosphoribosyltransferase n=1 Tax=Halalkalibacter akibai (strain ATCC 43226 / DSM 21942 / CIP 109018 / JCM 9157 / 1139) TaxID=1236973 RepID=W4QN45_HALA3|nr:nicotinate-nucleotide--dimethylbenzimidazole phosphoribosyltransferase [Halalkalibacter akibai]GAE33520.1 nicotinate-nucleotide-dimethylbenzimidazole phosphoribosyltransferase [Halalkalibacter akibai JCM 9157]